MPHIAALILAAGASTRMGHPKQLCQFQGVSFLRHTANLALETSCSPVFAVLQPAAGPIAAELIDLPISIIENPCWQNGIGTSLRAGIIHILRCKPLPSHVLIMLCDQPLVTLDHLQQILRRAASARPVCVSFDGIHETPPVLIASELFPELLKIPDQAGAKSIWAHRPEIVERVYFPNASLDIDTPTDLAKFLATQSSP